MHNTHSTIKSVYYVDIIGTTEYTVHIIVIQIRNISQVFIQGFGDAITISVEINKQEQMKNAKIVARKLINVFSAIVSVLIVSIAIIIANISFK